MDGDLVSLRMMVIAATRPDRELWRQGASMVNVPVEFSAIDAESAIDLLIKGGPDICVVDHAMPTAEKMAIIEAARAARSAPLIFVSAPPGSARPDGVDGLLVKPMNKEEAHKVSMLCVRTKLPTRVLVVDDSSTMRSIVRKILLASRFPMDMHEAAEGFAALERLRRESFGMVFLDYNMPGLNGFETLSEIKRVNPKTAVVIMTSTVDEEVASGAYAAGALAFLKKPFYPTDIDHLLERYFGLRSARG